MNRKLAVASAATAGIAVIALSACSPHHSASAHHVTVGGVGVAGGAVPAADCAVSVTRKHITAYVDFHGTVDGLTAGSQCHELTRLSTRQSYVTATQVTAIPASFKSVCAATSAKGYTATVYSDNPLGDAAGKQFCKAFSRK